MLNKLDESLRPHLSALVDGELEPLEAIAIQRHVRHNDALATEQRALEQLKLAVHLAGTRDPAPLGLRARLLARVHGEAEARRSRRRWAWAVPLVAAVAVLIALTAPRASDATSPATDIAATPPTEPHPSAPYNLDDDALSRLARVHLGELPPVALRDMSESGAMVQHGEVDRRFIDDGDGHIVQASFMDCNPRERGDTFAQFDADRVTLSASVDAALEGAGVYSDVIDGVEIRITTTDDKVLVLLRTAPAASISPI